MLESFCIEDIVDEGGKEQLGLNSDRDVAANDDFALVWGAWEVVYEGKLPELKTVALGIPGTLRLAPDSSGPLAERSMFAKRIVHQKNDNDGGRESIEAGQT